MRGSRKIFQRGSIFKNVFFVVVVVVFFFVFFLLFFFFFFFFCFFFYNEWIQIPLKSGY